MRAAVSILSIIALGLISISLKAQTFTGLQPVQLATGFQFTEGPAWHPDGYIVFSDIDGNTIYKWSDENGIETFSNNIGNSNGIACSKKNEFFVCRHSNRDIAKISGSGAVSTFASSFNGKKFNSPNDVELSYMGSVYFTDPDFGANTATRELTFEGLFCIPYNQTEPVLLDSTLIKPNGLAFVDDWRTLYVAESNTNTIYSYFLRDEYLIQDISKDKKVFLNVQGSGEIDGMCADLFGNLYVAFGDGGIKIYNRNATEIGQISFPAKVKVRNLCFGGKYKNILFVTAGTSLYKVDIRFFGDFIAPGLLSIPTDKSVVFNALSDKALSAYISYGTNSGDLSLSTSVADFEANTPFKIWINSLSPDTKYFYQLKYKVLGETEFKNGASGSFQTQRASGSVFSFAVEADPHLDESSNYLTYRNSLKNALNLSPDFLIDLGDNFLTEKFPIVDEYYLEQRMLLYRNFWDSICHSVPLYIVQGNHDAELGWLNENSAGDVFNLSNSLRKKYYPMPEADGFYTGNDLNIPFFGKRQNYYAWKWGDALFVVIDPYAYTLDKTSDPWCFTLGKEQYDWFRETLENSKSKYKFVFAHQLVGGIDALGRGGVEAAHLYENGGYNADGSYGFDEKRPGWGKPLHQIMVENKVQIYFHGHDHFYAMQEKDGLIYQEVPQPSFPGYTVANDAETYGYATGVILPNSGHLNVTILGDSARIDYIGGYHNDIPKKNQINGQIRETYYVKAYTGVPSGLSNIKESTSVQVYQTGKTIIIRSDYSSDINIDMYSLNGQLVRNIFNGNIQTGQISVALPQKTVSGIYVLKVRAGQDYQTLKIVMK